MARELGQYFLSFFEVTQQDNAHIMFVNINMLTKTNVLVVLLKIQSAYCDCTVNTLKVCKVKTMPACLAA